jgi:hypothetical protein
MEAAPNIGDVERVEILVAESVVSRKWDRVNL